MTLTYKPVTGILRDLGDELILRRGVIEDTDELAAFNAYIFRNSETQAPNDKIEWWTRDLMHNHPTVRPCDFTIVENTCSHKIVSSLVWISQRWSYEGIEFGVGRPEMVGSHPDFRSRGIVRAQFEVAHEWSAQRGELIQAITGIPFFYRQFGYEMTMNLGGGRAGYRPQVPILKKDETEPYRIRAANDGDLAFVVDLYARRARRQLVDCVRDEKMWLYELSQKSDRNATRTEARVIETAQGERIGVLSHPPTQAGQTMYCSFYELAPNVSWVAVTPSVIRYLWATGTAYNERDKKDGVSEFAFGLGDEHPVYTAMKDHLPYIMRPYAWYIRVPGVVAFLKLVSPALERHLEQSVVAGHSGELKLSFYRGGVRLVFEHGCIKTVETWKPTPDDGGNAAFPGLTFLQLLFGYRSMEELRHAFADCWAGGNAARALLDALFPKRNSDVGPIA
jgi:Acetyltransferase (GNAT) domain